MIAACFILLSDSQDDKMLLLLGLSTILLLVILIVLNLVLKSTKVNVIFQSANFHNTKVIQDRFGVFCVIVIHRYLVPSVEFFCLFTVVAFFFYCISGVWAIVAHKLFKFQLYLKQEK